MKNSRLKEGMQECEYYNGNGEGNNTTYKYMYSLLCKTKEKASKNATCWKLQRMSPHVFLFPLPYIFCLVHWFVVWIPIHQHHCLYILVLISSGIVNVSAYFMADKVGGHWRYSYLYKRSITLLYVCQSIVFIILYHTRMENKTGA